MFLSCSSLISASLPINDAYITNGEVKLRLPIFASTSKNHVSNGRSFHVLPIPILKFPPPTFTQPSGVSPRLMRSHSVSVHILSFVESFANCFHPMDRCHFPSVSYSLLILHTSAVKLGLLVVRSPFCPPHHPFAVLFSGCLLFLTPRVFL